MHPINELRKLLSAKPRSTGTIVSADYGSITVATTTGVVTVNRLPGDATAYRAGDTAVLLDGRVIGRRSGDPPIYVV